MNEPKSILITGASSGIGKAMAIEYAKPGVTLALTGRNKERLQEVAIMCQQQGAQVETASIDVTEANLLKQWINEYDKNAPLDLVIANAGISNAGENRGEEYDRKIFAINLQGVLNTIHPAIELMVPRKHGQLAIMSSLASLVSAPRAPAYCASKAAVKTYGEALRNKLKRFGINVSVICPGFVKTPLTDQNEYAMPFMLSVQKAAKITIHGLKKNHGLIAYPWRMYFILWLLRLLPAKMIEKISSYL